MDVEREIQAGRLQLKIYPKWEVLERYGIGGEEVGVLQKDTLLFPIVFTLPEEFKGDVSRLKSFPIFERDGRISTLGDVADLKVEPGLFIVRRENNIRFALVMGNVEGRDVGSFVEDLKKKIEEEVKLPKGYFITFGGQFESQQRAMKNSP